MNNSANILAKTIEYTDDKFLPINIDNTEEFLEICKDIKELDLLPIKKVAIRFSSDTWDFTPLLTEKQDRTIFFFSDVPYSFKDTLKFYVYHKITRDRKLRIRTINTQFKSIRLFVRFLDNRHITSLEFIDSEIISDYIKYLYHDKENTYSTILKYVIDIKSMIDFYVKNMANIDLSSLFNTLDKSISKLISLNLSVREENKHQNIPSKYYNNLLSTSISLMRNPDLDEITRGYGAFIVLISQTGLRISQMLELKVNAVSKAELSDVDSASYFLEFTSKKIKTITTCRTVLNSLGYEAFSILQEVFSDYREQLNTSYLFCPNHSEILPIPQGVFMRKYKLLIATYGHDIGAINVGDMYPELTSVRFDNFKKHDFSNKLLTELGIDYSDSDVISYPTMHQFRVHLCTYLYNKSVPLKFIQKYMSHLNEEMSDYYIRRPEYSKQDDEFSKEILKVIVKEDTKPLGDGSSALISKIDDFIKEGKFNVVKDIDLLISALKGKMPIRQKTGGVCIKSNIDRDCRVDEQSDEIYCAYGVCPNHFHFYIMADITYNDCITLIKTIEYNRAEGYPRQANKELGKLKSIIEKALIPEIEQLEFEINRKGYNWIKENHENLVPIMDNLDKIKEEIIEWKNKQPLILKKK